MKNYILLTCLLVMSLLSISCHKDNLAHEKDFNNSYNAWVNFKTSSANSYRYTVVGGSVFGYGWETIITVTAGTVTKRYFKFTPPKDHPANIPANEPEWTENASEIDTHPQSGAASAVTLDDIYEKARTEWLPKRKNASTYFEARNNGMISSCGYVEDGCQDDCFRGINISAIQGL